MKLEIFAVYDSKAEAYITPFFQPKTNQAKRVFQNASQDIKHAFGRNPEDYTLFHLGSWDDDTALLKPNKTPESLGLALEYQTMKTLDPQLDLVEEVQQQEAK